MSSDQEHQNNTFVVAQMLGSLNATQTRILSELEGIRTDLAAHVAADAKTFAEMKTDADKAKGAGWVILSLLGGLATFVGGAVIAAIGGIIKIHF